MCGIIGVSNHEEAANVAFLGLCALQHRGEEAAGIVSYDGGDIHITKNKGLVADAFDEQSLKGLKGKTAIGHSRYSTTGSNNYKNKGSTRSARPSRRSGSPTRLRTTSWTSSAPRAISRRSSAAPRPGRPTCSLRRRDRWPQSAAATTSSPTT